MRICDPHFHLWDLPRRPNPNLGAAVERDLPRCLAADYLGRMGRLPAPLELTGCVHVETVVGQVAGGYQLDSVEETRFVRAQMEPTGVPFGVVAYVHLVRDPAQVEVDLARHAEAAAGRLRGVRMILNHHPGNPDLTWPQVERGDFLRDPRFAESLALLAERGLSFDLQCNPHQLVDAAAAFAAHPRVPVILGHLGSFHGPSAAADPAYEPMWRAGMAALALLPQARVKLSMLYFCAPGYHRDPAREAHVRGLVLETIDRFGCGRCMFASNDPVDGLQGIDIPTLYGRFLAWTADRPAADRAALFHDTAVGVYRLP